MSPEPMNGLRAFGINADRWTTAAQGEGEWRNIAEQGAERFMAKWIAAEKARTGLRHALLVVVLIVCPNMTTGRIKARIAQDSPKQASSFGSLAIVVD